MHRGTARTAAAATDKHSRKADRFEAMKRLITLAFFAALQLAAQPACQQIADTLYGVGTESPIKANGTIDLSLGYTTIDGSFTVVQSIGRQTITNGTLATCPPPGLYQANYTLRKSAPLTGTTSFTRYWVIPTGGSGPYSLSSVPVGTVNTNGNSVSWATGITFGSVSAGDIVTIGTATCTAAAPSSLTLLAVSACSSPLGSQTGVAFNDGPIERQSFSPPFPSVIGGPQGPGPGLRVYSQTVSAATSVLIPAATHGLGANVIVQCEGVAECPAVNVGLDGSVSIQSNVAWSGTADVISAGASYVLPFASATTASATWLQTGLSNIFAGACYDAAGNQFGVGNFTLSTHALGLTGMWDLARDISITLSSSVAQTGRCILLGD